MDLYQEACLGCAARLMRSGIATSDCAEIESLNTKSTMRSLNLPLSLLVRTVNGCRVPCLDRDGPQASLLGSLVQHMSINHIDQYAENVSADLFEDIGLLVCNRDQPASCNSFMLL